jgi:succinate-semialdehyde dehydrogenase / glutarate-semialdehyde dehydrogenase
VSAVAKVSDIAVPTGLFIAGEWRPAGGGAVFDVMDPATGKALCSVADATAGDAAAALDAAVSAQRSWAATSPRTRAEMLQAAFAAVTARERDFATLITREMGKPYHEAAAEVAYGAEFLRWFAEQAAHVRGDFGPSPDGSYRIITTKQPVGPSLLITPWNFPIAMATRKIGAAMAAGCTMVMKAAQQTPLTMNLFAEVLAEAGVPAGVLNVVTTRDAAGVSKQLMADPRLRKVSFTGSTGVGSTLLRQSADNVLRTSLELGGNGPFLVFDDADMDAAIDGAMLAKLRNGGQSCVAANRFLVQRPVLEEFTQRLTDRFAKLGVGDGMEAGTDVGPLIDGKQRDKVAELVDDAVAKGARAVLGGKALDRPGFFYAPTILTGVPRSARMYSEEVFGPVAAIYPFGDDDEGIAAANDTAYGLVSYLYSRDGARALRAAEALEAGMVGINRGLVSNPAAPFGGIKASGLGREGGELGIDEFLEVKQIALQV